MTSVQDNKNQNKLTFNKCVVKMQMYDSVYSFWDVCEMRENKLAFICLLLIEWHFTR